MKWYNTTICHHLNEASFEGYFTPSQKYRYNIICSIESYGKLHKPFYNFASSCGDKYLPYTSTSDALVFLEIHWEKIILSEQLYTDRNRVGCSRIFL